MKKGKDLKENNKKINKLLLIILIISLIIFIITLITLVTKATLLLDYSIYLANKNIQNPFLTLFFILITSLANTIPLITISIILGLFFIFRKRYYYLAIFMFSMLIGFITENLLKIIIHRIRPSSSIISMSGYSFPSGHATMAIIFLTLIIAYTLEYLKNKKARIFLPFLLVLLILLIGYSRIYLGVHWFSDIVAGYSLGLFVLSSSAIIIKKVEKSFKL